MNIKKYNVQYVELGEKIEARIDGEIYGIYEDLVEAQDNVEDLLHGVLRSESKYTCPFCQEYYNEEDVQHRIEDSTFTAPYGSTFVLGGDVASVAVCPICSDDLEEC